ncbi:MAG: diaminobutyrate acetyltransferase [Sulfurimonas sp.]
MISTFRIPTLKDSPAVYDLVDHCKPLDLNSRYAYMLVCTHFSETSIVYESDGEIKGFVSGYIDPRSDKTLFIWQVAVHSSLRGQGIASRMLTALLSRKNLSHIEYIETTISPSNKASQNLFRHLTSEINTEMSVEPYFDKDLFGGEAHEDEELYRIGPFNNKGEKQL